MKRLKRSFAVVAFWVVSLSCATATAFHGPISDRPQLSVSYMRHFETRDPRLPEQLVTITTAAITNPSTHAMRLRLDCTRTLITLTVAPRTTEHVLLDPKDRSCTLTEVRS